MRILYHHRTLADGAEGIHIAEMVAAFRELGHDVDVLGLVASTSPAARRGWMARMRAAAPAVLFELAAIASNAVEYVQVRRAIAASSNSTAGAVARIRAIQPRRAAGLVDAARPSTSTSCPSSRNAATISAM